MLSDLLINSLKLSSGSDGLDDLLTVSSCDSNLSWSDDSVGSSDISDDWSSDDSDLVGNR